MRPHPRLSINQATIKYAPYDDALRVVRDAGIESIGLWREPVAEVGLAEAALRLTDSGLRMSTYCRAGFFTAPEGAVRRASIDDNRRAIDETATLAAAGAMGSEAVLVLVAGGIPAGSTDLVGSRERVRDAVAELAPDAAAAGVTLAIEPLHPMYVSDRAVISTLGQALDIAEQFDATVGVVVDTFHVWWDPQLSAQISRAGGAAGDGGRIATYQVCDWATPLATDVLLSRHYPGDGVIDFGAITRAVLATGYAADIEVEIFNQEIWNSLWSDVVERTSDAFSASVGVHLDSAAARN